MPSTARTAACRDSARWQEHGVGGDADFLVALLHDDPLAVISFATAFTEISTPAIATSLPSTSAWSPHRTAAGAAAGSPA